MLKSHSIKLLSASVLTSVMLSACSDTTAPVETAPVKTAKAEAPRQAAPARPTPPAPLPLGFFVTSEGSGQGGDLGGLAGADAHCQMLAAKVGSGDRTWRAYLSTQKTGSTPAVNAVDRIGTGPWGNAKGVTIAADLNHLLFDNSNINIDHVLTEKGDQVNSRILGSSPNKHDILTGSQIDGTVAVDMNCQNWTSSSDGDKAIVGHSDRHRFTFPGSPWNSAHATRGCSLDSLKATGGDGLFYCFAAD